MSDQYPTSPQGEPDPTQPHQSYGQPGQPGQPGQQAYGQQPTTAYQATPTAMSPQDERTWGAVSHAGAVVAMICSAGFLGFIASIAVYVIYKDRGPFVRAHAANSLNIQIVMFVWLVVFGVAYVVLSILSLGLGFFVLWPIFWVPPVIAFVLHVLGTVKAYQGEWWSPPLTPAFIK